MNRLTGTLFGMLTKATPPLSGIDTSRGWWPMIRESFTGAWQSNVTVSLVDVLQHPTVFACITLIASDIAKMRLRLVERDSDGIWTEVDSPAFSPVLRKPNRYQTRITFIKCWLISKLAYGNAYILKQRDNRGVVIALYVLDPSRVKPLVSQDGAVYYELRKDTLSNLNPDTVILPASEVIHDVMHPLYHPLVGLSPIYACGLSATLGLRIQTNSAKFFGNMSRPSGMLTAPGAITNETALRLKDTAEAAISGENIGRLLMAGDGLKFEAFNMTAVDSQLTEQWKESSKTVCSTFRVPAYKVGVEPPPSYNNIEALDRQYYSQCLQEHIETIELLLDEGLGLAQKIDGRQYGTEFDLDDLLRLDSATMTTTLAQGTGAGIVAINEARYKLNLPPAEGGEEPILQQQNWPLSQLASREPPTIPGRPDQTTPPASQPPPADDGKAIVVNIATAIRRKQLERRCVA